MLVFVGDLYDYVNDGRFAAACSVLLHMGRLKLALLYWHSLSVFMVGVSCVICSAWRPRPASIGAVSFRCPSHASCRRNPSFKCSCSCVSNGWDPQSLGTCGGWTPATGRAALFYCYFAANCWGHSLVCCCKPNGTGALFRAKTLARCTVPSQDSRSGNHSSRVACACRTSHSLMYVQKCIVWSRSLTPRS